MEKIWVRKSASFKEAEEFEENYYSEMSVIERIDTVQLLREQYLKMDRSAKNASRKGLRRVIKIIQPT